MIKRTHRSTLFPYTTLFRSREKACQEAIGESTAVNNKSDARTHRTPKSTSGAIPQGGELISRSSPQDECDCILASLSRSEEHTSELQSHSDLVCRLLLEKKK